MQGQVRIGREFFAKSKNDYANWRWAWVRELVQNSVDAYRSNRIDFTFSLNNQGNTIAVAQNNGEPMTREVLVDKFLTHGGSGKNFQVDGRPTIGGFGRAKELICYCNLSWSIRTGDMLAAGSGGDYEITNDLERFHGTRTEAEMEGDHTSELCDAVRKLAKYAQWGGTLTLNGERLETNLRKGSRRKELEWGVIYTNQSYRDVAVIRVDGIPMFVTHARYPKGMVLVELTGESARTLTSNRDGLRYPYSSEFSDLLTAIAVDKRSALREQRAQYKRYLGEKLRAERAEPKASEVGLADIIDVAALVQAPTRSGGEPVPVTVTESGIKVCVESQEDIQISLGHEFIIKQTTGMETPAYYTPGPEFSKYSRDLVRVWAACLVELYRMFEINGSFSVGFVFDEDCEAECEHGPYGLTYYISPARLVCQRSKPQCRSFKARYTGAWSNRFEIIAVAVHEFIHGAFGLKEHDEIFASKYTEAISTVLGNMSRLTPLFRS